MQKNNYSFGLTIICFTAIALFLTFNRHSKSGYFNYHSEIWADKAGYYVYLPAAVKFKFNPAYFPGAIESKTGHGFKLDHDNKKVITKYTYGVALLQLPFFLMADQLAPVFNHKADGFSPVYHWSINIAAVFYLVTGLFFLFKYLQPRFGSTTAYLVLASLFLGTNLYYYAIDDTGMSHVYSFALFSIYLYLLQQTGYLFKQHFWQTVGVGGIAALIVLIRPSNIIFLSAFFFMDITGVPAFFERIKRLLRLKTVVLICCAATIIMLPQLIYWYHISGSAFLYPYGNEGFNWLHPQPWHTWFSPNNGLFLYNPVYLVLILSLIYMIRNRQQNAVWLLVLFLTISYVFSAWWDWSFGCSFGARSYVEYLAVFSVPLAQLYQKIKELDKIKITGFCFLMVVLIAFNLKMTYTYDGCFYGTREWDWQAYLKLVVSPTK